MFGKKETGFKELNETVPDTLIASNVTIKGDIQFSGGIQIDGTINGNLSADDGSSARLWVSEKGRVNGQVIAPSITINGHVEGDVHCAEHLELASNAIVNGNVFYKVIEMAQGAVVNGSLHKEESPSTASAIAKKPNPFKAEGKSAMGDAIDDAIIE